MVKQIVFAPNEPGIIYGVADLYEEEQMLPAKAHLFRIDNRWPELTSVIDYVTLTEHSNLSTINLHMSDDIGRIFWVNTK